MYTGIVELDLVKGHSAHGWAWREWSEDMAIAIEQPGQWLYEMAYINF